MKVGLFPGQGISAREVLRALPPGHPTVQHASELLCFDLRRRVEVSLRGRSTTLPTSLAQPAIFTASVIAWDESPEAASCDFLLGHSLGEYAALVASGAISFAHGCSVVQVRGDAMEAAARAAPGGMIAILGLDEARVFEVSAASGAVVANDNAPGQVVLSGPEDSLTAAARLARAAGGRAVRLEVSGPFHSHAMAPASGALAEALDRISIRKPSIPVVSNVTATAYEAPTEIRRMLVAQVTGSVRFRSGVAYLWERGVTELLDLGPGRVVGGLVRRGFDELRATSVATHA